MEQNHLQALAKLCRICGGKVDKYRVSYKTTDHKESLKIAFAINIDTDHHDIHPVSFCDRCFAVLKRKEKAVIEDRVYIHSIGVVEWFPHSSFCLTCDSYGTLRKGGRTKITRKNRGMPSKNSCHHVSEHIKAVALPCFFEQDKNIKVNSTQPLSIPPSDFTCSICDSILNSPIKLSCGSLTCSYCLLHWIESSQSTRCPSCDRYHDLMTSDIVRVDDLHHRVLECLSVLCDLCGKVTRLGDFFNHTNSKCTQFILQTPNTSICHRIVVRENEIKIRTGGKVSHNVINKKTTI